MFPTITTLSLATLALPAAQWNQLFDGRTLSGWEQKNGTATYKVEAGVIVGTTAEGSPNSFLATTKTYGNFILEFEVKVDPELNSGVQFRSHAYEKDTELVNKKGEKHVQKAGRVYGYQVEIADAATGSAGRIYDEARRGDWLDDIAQRANAKTAFKDNQWNRYRVEAKGDSIKTFVNGVLVADIRDSMDASGFIALQVHSYKGESPKQVRWRKIRIQEQ